MVVDEFRLMTYRRVPVKLLLMLLTVEFSDVFDK